MIANHTFQRFCSSCDYIKPRYEPTDQIRKLKGCQYRKDVNEIDVNEINVKSTDNALNLKVTLLWKIRILTYIFHL